MDDFIKEYRKTLENARTNNRAEVVEAAKVKAPWLIKKIDNTVMQGLFGTTEHVLNAILSGNEFATAMFSKDPSKQGWSEKVQIKFANDRGIKLTKCKGHTRFNDGELVHNKKAAKAATKSLDYNCDEINAVLTAKVTDWVGGVPEGGNQGTIKDEMRKTIGEWEKFIRKNDNGKMFIALLDGSLFTKENLDWISESIPADLTDRIKVMTSVQLVNFVVSKRI